MKTRIIQTAIIVLLFIMNGMAQQDLCSRSMEVTIVSSDTFEASRQALMEQCTGENYFIVSMTEIKDGSKPRSVDMEFYTDEIGFRAVDLMLEKLGHVAFKKSTISQTVLPLDTTFLHQTMKQNNELISIISAKIAECENIDADLNKIKEIQKINEKIAFDLNLAEKNPALRSRIVIHLTD